MRKEQEKSGRKDFTDKERMEIKQREAGQSGWPDDPAFSSKETENKPKIREVIIVEGKDDVAAVKQAVDAQCLITHGHGFGEELLDQLEVIHERRGIIVMTDPDYAGKKIRRRILERIPDAKIASLDRLSANRAGDIGVENAAPVTILQALKKARASLADGREEFTRDDLLDYGLDGQTGAKSRRIVLCRELGIPYSNAKSLLPRLNAFGITREEFSRAMAVAHKEVDGQ